MNSPDPNDKKIYCDLCCLHPNGDLVWNPFACEAKWDAPTWDGPWAYCCERHLSPIIKPVADKYLLKRFRTK